MATVKVTQKEMFNAIIKAFKGEDAGFTNDELIEFVEGRIAVLDKKSANRKTKVNEEDEALKEAILAVLANGEKMTVTAIMQADDTLGAKSNQKISALLRKLRDVDGKVASDKDKKSTVFYAVA